MFSKSIQELLMVTGGIEIFSPAGVIILILGLLFTVGVPLTMILKGKKD
tara:strand:- start:510 stop:656 length:147 start_codon:yes stop_codon:yes gene_type:complete